MDGDRIIARFCIFICCLMMVLGCIIAALEDITYLIWLVLVAVFVLTLYLIFQLCENLGNKYVFQNPQIKAENQKVIQEMLRRSEQSIRQHSEQNAMEYLERQNAIEMDRKFIQNNSFFFIVKDRIIAVFMIALIIGGIMEMVGKLSGIKDFPLGLISGSLFAVSAYLILFIRFIIRIIKGYKETKIGS